jgi:hypothetical protein
MKKLKIIAVLLPFIGMTSCKKYLEEPNKIQASITTADQLLALEDNVNGTSPDWAQQFSQDAAICYYTDDTNFDLTALKANPNGVGSNAAFYYTFDIDNIINAAATDPLWNNNWQRVLTANIILSNVDNVTGSQDIKNMVKANAYFDRAYAYWSLVNHYCQPYSSSTLQTLGLPLRKTSSYTESLTRATLNDTYAFILDDITQAQSFVTYTDVQPLYRWRISKTGIEAFLSRYYLFTGDYANALAHANNALISTGGSLADFNTIPLATNPTTYKSNGVSYTVNYGAFTQYAASQYLNWQEFYYTSYSAGLNTGTNSLNASPALVATYDLPSGTSAKANDLRYKLLMPDNSGFSSGWTIPGLNSYKQFYLNLINTGPSVPEVLLNKAEAAARLGDFATAGAAVNALRLKRFTTGYANVNETFTSANALTLVLQERRRELPFAFRFFDIRRFAYNSDASDDVIVTRTFYNVTPSSVDLSSTKSYTLPLKSTHYMIPIPNLDIVQAKGDLIQNAY